MASDSEDDFLSANEEDESYIQELKNSKSSKKMLSAEKSLNESRKSTKVDEIPTTDLPIFTNDEKLEHKVSKSDKEQIERPGLPIQDLNDDKTDKLKSIDEKSTVETPRSDLEKLKITENSNIKKTLQKPRKKLGQKITPLKSLDSVSCDSLENKNQDKDNSEVKDNTLEQKSSTIPDVEETMWGSWGGWGSSLISTASMVSQEVTKTFGGVLETVSGPDVDDGRSNDSDSINKSNEKDIKDTASSSLDMGLTGIGTLLSGVSGAFESASNTILMGGLDTLEKIGRTTMNIIQDGDPGLKRKREFLRLHKPSLSVVLKEARERAIIEETQRSQESDGENVTAISIATTWEDKGGPAHLEAVSLIAKQCKEKRYTLIQDLSTAWKVKLEEQAFNITEYASIDTANLDTNYDISRVLSKITVDVALPLQFNKLMSSYPSFQNFLNRLCIEIQSCQPDSDLTPVQIEFFKEISSFAVEVVAIMHKAAEVSLITPKVDGEKLAQQFNRLCCGVSTLLEESSDKVCESISVAFPSDDSWVSEAITNIYVQISNLNSFVERGLIDLVSVLAYVAAKTSLDEL